jgi:photosystem II biogenesis protein Psp29
VTVNTVQTVSDTKRTFYTLHTRPVSSIFRRVVEELMVEIHLLRVNSDFRYDPVFALGVVTTFDRFMDGYQPEADKESIFSALCNAEQMDMAQFRNDAEMALNAARSHVGENFVDWMGRSAREGGADLAQTFRDVAQNTKFKYSRLFGIGLYTLMETAHPEGVKESTALSEALTKVGEALNLSSVKLEKDLELYRSNLDKVQQARQAISDMIEADRKKREQREQEKKAAAEAAANGTTPPEPSGSESSSEAI